MQIWNDTTCRHWGSVLRILEHIFLICVPFKYEPVIIVIDKGPLVLLAVGTDVILVYDRPVLLDDVGKILLAFFPAVECDCCK